MPDLTDRLAEWRKATDGATRGEWTALTDTGYRKTAPYAFVETETDRWLRIEGALEGSFLDAWFIATARTAMPKLLAAVDRVLAIHQPALIYPLDDTGMIDMDAEPIMEYCALCTPSDTDERIEDGEWTDDLETVQWPCATVRTIITALEGA